MYPFDWTTLFKNVPSLEYIHERKFHLIYSLGMSASDCLAMSSKNLEWYYNRLVKQKRDERKAHEDAIKSQEQ